MAWLLSSTASRERKGEKTAPSFGLQYQSAFWGPSRPCHFSRPSFMTHRCNSGSSSFYPLSPPLSLASPVELGCPPSPCLHGTLLGRTPGLWFRGWGRESGELLSVHPEFRFGVMILEVTVMIAQQQEWTLIPSAQTASGHWTLATNPNMLPQFFHFPALQMAIPPFSRLLTHSSLASLLCFHEQMRAI